MEKKKEQLKALESVCATTKRSTVYNFLRIFKNLINFYFHSVALEEYVAKNEDIKDRLKSHIETNERNLGVKIRILEGIFK